MSGNLSGSTSLTPPAPAIISFNEIPYNWRVPGNYMEIKAAINDNAVLAWPARGLIMGQMYSTGTAAAGTAYNIQSVEQANGLFGTGSIIAKQCVKWLANNPYTPVDAIGISDAAGSAKAVNTITTTGTATAPGTQAVYVGGVRVPVPVNVGDTAAVFSANLFAALQQQAQPGFIPLPSQVPTYAGGAAVVTLTCGHGGTLGNQIDIRLNAQIGDMTPPGLSIAIARTVPGATDPAAQIASVLAGITTWYTDVAFAWTDATNIAAFDAWMIGRYGAMTALDVQGYVVTSGSYGTVQTFQPNCKYLSVLPVQNPLNPSWEWGAAFAARTCYETAQRPALQLRGVPLSGITAPAGPDVFSAQENEVLLNAGFCTYSTDSTGGVYLQRVTTSYRLDPSGVPNNHWFDISSTKVPSRVRYDWDGYMGQVWPRNFLAQDGSIAANYNPDVVTPGLAKAAWAGRCTIYEQNGWIQNSAQTAANSAFAIDQNDGNRMNARQQIQVMGNLIVLAGSLEFISATN